MHDVLFPYARRHLADFLARHADDAAVMHVLRDAAEAANEPGAGITRIIEILQAWMRDDRKITPLKTLQGLMWADGYASGELQGHVYPDAVTGLQRWHAAGIALYVYSSGSIAAQRLLFRHSTAGDVTPLFDGYFDTTIGIKDDVASYERIAAEIGRAPGEILFLSDRAVELGAAQRAGWQVAHLVRPADAPAGSAGEYPAFTTFAAIDVRRRA